MKYKIIGTRGVLEEGAPFLLNEEKSLQVVFENLPEGEYFLKLSDRNTRKVETRIKGNSAEIQSYRLRPGLWYAELLQKIDGAYRSKIVCTPIRVENLATATEGYICYPEIDEVLKLQAEYIAKVDELLQWRDKVAPLIHKHKVIY